LRALLSHCYANVPYYRKLFAEMGLYKRDLKDPGLLARLPILNKQTLTTERADLQANDSCPGSGARARPRHQAQLASRQLCSTVI
jgi:phenylacetate-CoA ligase